MARRNFFLFALLVSLGVLPGTFADTNTNTTFPVTITVNAAKPLDKLIPIWRFFGADEPNYAYMKDGEKLLGELGRLGKPQVYFRAHHLLTSGDGAHALKFGSTSAYKEDAKGNPVYDWTINDRIFDAYLTNGIKPYVEIGFMPEALTTHPQNYPHNPPENKRVNPAAGMSYPPKSYAKWGELVHQWVKHCVKRYGRSEVESWYWEVWNEPNIFYWHGSRQDYFKLYDYAVEGVLQALPTARVGGPETAGGPGGTFLRDFLNHCLKGTNYVTGKIGSPLDFISFHAKGSPRFIKGHVRMGMAHELRAIKNAFTVIDSFPQFRKLPVVIGECDPEGCAACREPRDAYRNGTMYSSYTAAAFPCVMELARQYDINLEGALTWAFEFEDQPPFAGFRQLASAGLDLPVLNVFRMFGKMSGQRLPVKSSAGLDAKYILAHNVRSKPDISAQACLDKHRLAVMVWYYHDDDLPGPVAAVDLQLHGIPAPDGKLTLTHYRVDADHSNSYEAWKRMGSPSPLTTKQYAELEKDGKLAELDQSKPVEVKAGRAEVKFNLPRQGVSLLVLTWK